MPGETDLSLMLASIEPRLLDREVVYVTSDDMSLAAQAYATVVEDEGPTVVLPRAAADAAGLDYDFVGAWISLSVHSDLAAVGLTAAISAALTTGEISCNVIAGHFHDHLIVPWDRRHDALEALSALRLKHERE